MNIFRKKAVSLIEILVAGIVMVALVLPLTVIFSHTLRSTEVSLQEIMGLHLADELVEQLRVIPFSVGFSRLFERPFPNPPPDYPEYIALAPSSSMPCAGFALPSSDDWCRDTRKTVQTGDWSLTGPALTFETGSSANPLTAERSRIFLSPLPDQAFHRFFQIYRPIRSLSPLAKESNIFKIVVKVEWASARSSDGRQVRSLILRGLVPNPEIQ